MTLAVAAALLVGCGADDGSQAERRAPEVPSPVPPAGTMTDRTGSPIPPGVLPIEADAAVPPPDPDMRWVWSEGADLPRHLSPCRLPLPTDAARVAGRQIVVTPTAEALARGRPPLWKSVRLVLYRDADAARRAVAEVRQALVTCAEHDEGDGVTTRWRGAPLAIGDEAVFVGGQMYRGDRALQGHYRGVVARQDRGVVTYLDFGPLTDPPTVGETADQQAGARDVVARLASAEWL